MVKKNSIYLGHILDFIQEIEDYKNSFEDQKNLVTSAVLYKLTLIGEAVNRISNQVRQENPEIPWREIVGFRNRIIHEYEGVDQDILRNVIFVELPKLKIQIQKVFEKVSKIEDGV